MDLDGCAAIQKHIDRLEKWANRNVMKFHLGKCRVQSLEKNNPMHWYVLESSLVEQDLYVEGVRGTSEQVF